METKWYLETLPGRYAALSQDCAAAVPETAAVVEKCRDLMGAVTECTLGYEKRLKIGPWYAAGEDALYGHLKWILDRGLVMDALRSSLVEAAQDGTAVRREAYLEITGAREGCIAFCLHFTGREQEGTFREGRFR